MHSRWVKPPSSSSTHTAIRSLCVSTLQNARNRFEVCNVHVALRCLIRATMSSFGGTVQKSQTTTWHVWKPSQTMAFLPYQLVSLPDLWTINRMIHPRQPTATSKVFRSYLTLQYQGGWNLNRLICFFEEMKLSWKWTTYFNFQLVFEDFFG